MTLRLALPATALLLGLNSFSLPERTTVSFNTVLAQSQPEPPTDDRLPFCPPPPPPLDINGVAKQLGVTEAQLIQMLGIPPHPPRPPYPSHPSHPSGDRSIPRTPEQR